VEAVVVVFQRCKVQLIEPELPKDIVSSTWLYNIVLGYNNKSLRETGQGFDEDQPLYYVGNKDQGLMSSKLLNKIYCHKDA
jgi:hypothetical protein